MYQKYSLKYQNTPSQLSFQAIINLGFFDILAHVFPFQRTPQTEVVWSSVTVEISEMYCPNSEFLDKSLYLFNEFMLFMNIYFTFTVLYGTVVSLCH